MLYGEVRIAIAGTSPLEGAGVLCEILFEVKSDAEAGAISPLTLELIQFNGGAILPQQVSNGSVTVLIPEISLEPPKAPALSNVLITGSGFPPSKSVTVRFENTDVLSTSTDGLGAFSGTFEVPKVPAGSKIITVICGDITKTTTFQVTLALTVSPAAGPKGTLITVTGSGFPPNERITVDFGTTPALAYTFADEHGNFTVTFSADAQPFGSTTILARGISGVEGYGIFQMQPILEITPTQGNVGTQVEIRGYGFKASGLITIQFGTVAIAFGIPSGETSYFPILIPFILKDSMVSIWTSSTLIIIGQKKTRKNLWLPH